jgi:hypothetical protein
VEVLSFECYLKKRLLVRCIQGGLSDARRF